MAQRAWVSFGVAMFLGMAGCASPEAENPGEQGEALPIETPPTETPPTETPPVGEVAPGAGPDLPEEAPSSGTPEVLCPKTPLGATPTEAIVDPRPGFQLCAVSPDGCDAHRPAHARRAVPRPCRVSSLHPYNSDTYALRHDAAGRLTVFEGPRVWFESFGYDACGRLTSSFEDPASSMRYSSDEWEWTSQGLLARWRSSFFSMEEEMTVERNAQGELLGARVANVTYLPSRVLEKHSYTLGFQGRIERAEASSLDETGQPKEGLWQETRRYDDTGALVQIRRATANEGGWVKEFSQDRLVRHAAENGSWETRWTYGPVGELQGYATASQNSQTQVDYQYGEDGRLLQATHISRYLGSTGWTESQTVFAYRYAEDGRILFRDEVFPTATVTYGYEYVCEPEASTP
jgi:YD repeat-containing protein